MSGCSCGRTRCECVSAGGRLQEVTRGRGGRNGCIHEKPLFLGPFFIMIPGFY